MFTIFERFIIILPLIAGFFMLFITPYHYSKGLYNMAYYEEPKLSLSAKLLCMLPIVNVIKAEKVYYGRIGMSSIGTLSFVACFVLRILNVFLLPSVMLLNIVTVLLLVVDFIVFWVLNSFAVRNVLKDIRIESSIGTTAMCLLYPVGQYYIGQVLYKKALKLLQEEDTFK